MDYVRPNLRLKTAAWYEGIVETHLKPALGSIPLARLTQDSKRFPRGMASSKRCGGS